MHDSPLLLLAVLAALVAVPLVLRRLRASAPDAVRVLARTAVAKGAVLAVVAVGDRRLLIGTGERGVQLLTELPAQPDQVGFDDATTSSGLPTPGGPPPERDARKDVSDVTATELTALLGPVGAPVAPLQQGPRIGLVDRLRVMTVRTPVRGRPLDVLRR